MKLKKLMMLFLLVSFICFGEDKIEPQKSYEVIQREEIDFLKTQLIKSNNKIDDLSKKIEAFESNKSGNLGLTYNVDQIYQNSMQYYDKTISHVKWIAGIAGAIISLLLTALLGSTWYIKNNNDKKLKKEKQEITKELDKRVERMWKENTELKEKIEKQEEEIERKTLELDEKVERVNKEMDEKIKTVEFNTELAMAVNKKDKRESLKNLKDLIKEYPEKEMVNFQLAYYLQQLGKDEEAIKYYEKAIRLEPNESVTYFNCGRSREILGDEENKKEEKDNVKIKKDYKEAIKDYKKAIELDENYEIAEYAKGKVEEKLKELEEKE